MHFFTDVLGGALLGVVWLGATVRGIRLGVAHWALRHGGGADAGRRPGRSEVRHG
jgi:membrane-associated phospholipid phosphatase